MINLDKAIEDFENATSSAGGTVQPIRYMDYFNNHNNGQTIIDLRLAFEFKQHHKISLICNNLFNRWYSLRPLKAEQMRSVLLQYVLKLGEPAK